MLSKYASGQTGQIAVKRRGGNWIGCLSDNLFFKAAAKPVAGQQRRGLGRQGQVADDYPDPGTVKVCGLAVAKGLSACADQDMKQGIEAIQLRQLRGLVQKTATGGIEVILLAHLRIKDLFRGNLPASWRHLTDSTAPAADQLPVLGKIRGIRKERADPDYGNRAAVILHQAATRAADCPACGN